VRIRVAFVDDARAIAEVHVRSSQAAYRGQYPDDYLDSLSADVRQIAWSGILAESDLPSLGTFVLEDDDRVLAGFVHVSPSRDLDATADTGEVTSIYLLPELWGAGYGRLLLDRATESLSEAGFSTATLWVLDTNVRARRFYERAGWTSDGTEKHEDRGTYSLHEVRYRRALSPR